MGWVSVSVRDFTVQYKLRQSLLKQQSFAVSDTLLCSSSPAGTAQRITDC